MGKKGGLLSFFKSDLPPPPAPSPVDYDRLLKKRESHLAGHEKHLQQKEAELRKKEARLADFETTLVQKQKSFSSKTAHVKDAMSKATKAEKHKFSIAKEIDSLEAQRNKLKDECSSLKDEVKALKDDLVDNRTELSSSERAIAKKYHELRQLQLHLESRSALLDNKEKILNDKDTGLVALNTQLQRRAKELHAQEQRIIDKARDAEEYLKKLQAKRDAETKEYTNLCAQTRQLESLYEKKKSDFQKAFTAEKNAEEAKAQERIELLKSQIRKAQRDLANHQAAALAANKEFQKRSQKLTQVQNELEKRNDLLTKKEQALEQKEEGLNALDRQLEKHQKDLKVHEKELAQDELNIANARAEIENAKEDLKKLRDALVEEINGKRAEFNDFATQWKSEVATISSIKADITHEKHTLNKLVQGDINALAEKEDEIVKAAKEFERDKKRLAKEEDQLIDRIKELEHVAHQHGKVEAQFKERENALKQYEDTLAKKEQLIQKTLKKAEEIKKQADAMKAKAAKVKEAKADLRRLEALRNEMEWTIEKDSRKVIGLTGKIHVREERMSQLKQKIPKKVPVPHRLTPAAPVEAPEHIEEVEEHTYEPPARTDHTEPGIAAARPAEIPHLLNQAHDAIAGHDLGKATIIVKKLQHIHTSLRDGEAKRTLGYEILDLKTSLKLAAIS